MPRRKIDRVKAKESGFKVVSGDGSDARQADHERLIRNDRDFIAFVHQFEKPYPCTVRAWRGPERGVLDDVSSWGPRSQEEVTGSGGNITAESR